MPLIQRRERKPPATKNVAPLLVAMELAAEAFEEIEGAHSTDRKICITMAAALRSAIAIYEGT